MMTGCSCAGEALGAQQAGDNGMHRSLLLNQKPECSLARAGELCRLGGGSTQAQQVVAEEPRETAEDYPDWRPMPGRLNNLLVGANTVVPTMVYGGTDEKHIGICGRLTHLTQWHKIKDTRKYMRR